MEYDSSAVFSLYIESASKGLVGGGSRGGRLVGDGGGGLFGSGGSGPEGGKNCDVHLPNKIESNRKKKLNELDELTFDEIGLKWIS